MKIKSLVMSINKDIEDVTKRKSDIQGQIALTKEHLKEVAEQIRDYDSGDISGFKELRDRQAFYEHNLKVLNRKMSEYPNTLDADKTKEYLRMFRAERENIMKSASKEIHSLAEKLDMVQTEANSELMELKRTFNLWVKTYNIPSSVQSEMFGVEYNTILNNVRFFVDKTKELTKG